MGVFQHKVRSSLAAGSGNTIAMHTDAIHEADLQQLDVLMLLFLQSGPELAVCLVLMEMSSPCLHNRAIFKVSLPAFRNVYLACLIRHVLWVPTLHVVGLRRSLA